MAIILNGTGSGFNRSVINENFQKIEDELNNNVLRRDGVFGNEDNAMREDLDMNSQRILNLPKPENAYEPARLIDLSNIIGDINLTPNASEVEFDGEVDYAANNVEDALKAEFDLRQALENRVTGTEGNLVANNLSIGNLNSDVAVLQNEMVVVQQRSLNNTVSISSLSNTKANRDQDAIEDNIATFDSNGNPVDSGVSILEIGSSSSATFVSETVPVGDIVSGNTWYKPSDASTYIYFEDGNSGQWVEDSSLVFQSSNEALSSLEELVSTSDVSPSGRVVQVLGYVSSGDGGFSLWKKVASNGVPSQLPKDTDDGTCVTASGDVYQNVDEKVNAKSFGASGSGFGDDTDALDSFLEHLRTFRKPGFLPTGVYKTSRSLDISGVELSGVYQGYQGENGTIIEGSGDHVIMEQKDQSLSSTTSVIDGFALRNGTLGLSLGYSLNSSVKNLYIKEVTEGVRIGRINSNGPIWVVVENVVARAEETGLIVEGLNWANALKFDTCFFTGALQGGRVKVGGGFGSIAPLFINTEFAGEGYGLVLDNVSNVTIVNGYFESEGPAIQAKNRCYGISVRDCVFGSLKNNNSTGNTSFIHHESGNCRMSVSGGYIALPDEPTADNLTFIQSDAPESFILKMTDQPNREVYSSGFAVFGDNLPNNLFTGFHRSSYGVEWEASTTNPSVGNGNLSGRYILNGSVCTVFIELEVGNTTDMGSGIYTFSIPFRSIAGSRAYGSGLVVNDGVIDTVPQVNSNSLAVALYDKNGDIVSSNQPSPWSPGDTVRFQITYEVA